MNEYFCPVCGAILNHQSGFDSNLESWMCTECGKLLTDEYFCPTCGAVLNYQDGFNPNCGFWTCTECGKLLTDDDSFGGIAWFCDNCNAFLNKQHGFSDIYTSWICTECGYVNSITENDIIDSNGVKDVDSNDIKCPICGDSLKDQVEYNEYEDEYTCGLCGTKLCRDYNGEPYSVVEDEIVYEETADEEASSSPIAEIVGAFLNLGLASLNLYDTFKSNSKSDDTLRKHNKGKKNRFDK